MPAKDAVVLVIKILRFKNKMTFKSHFLNKRFDFFHKYLKVSAFPTETD